MHRHFRLDQFFIQIFAEFYVLIHKGFISLNLSTRRFNKICRQVLLSMDFWVSSNKDHAIYKNWCKVILPLFNPLEFLLELICEKVFSYFVSTFFFIFLITLVQPISATCWESLEKNKCCSEPLSNGSSIPLEWEAIFFPDNGCRTNNWTRSLFPLCKGLNCARCKHLHFKWLLLACIMFDTAAATGTGLAAEKHS